MDRISAEQLLRALTGGAAPSSGDTIVFSDRGWVFGQSIGDGSTTISGSIRLQETLLSGSIIQTIISTLILGRGLRSDSNKVRIGHEVKILTIESGIVTPDYEDTFINEVTLTESVTINKPLNVQGDTYILIIKQDGLGPWAITWDDKIEWPGASIPAASGGKDIATFVVDSTGTVSGVLTRNLG